MAIKCECYNFWNVFNSFILRLYKAFYVVFVIRLRRYIKRSICAFLQPMAKFLCNSMQFRLHVESFKLDMINLACGVIRISIKCSCLEIFDQQESFKLDMIDLACGVIRISIKCSCLEIFDQQGNPNLIPLVLIPYHITTTSPCCISTQPNPFLDASL